VPSGEPSCGASWVLSHILCRVGHTAPQRLHQRCASTAVTGARAWVNAVSSASRGRAVAVRQPVLTCDQPGALGRNQWMKPTGGASSPIALGHTILIIVYDLLTRKQPDQDLGTVYFDKLEQHRVQQRLVHRLERLGYQVSLQPSVV
jgi:hypothetical protein